MLCDIKQQHEKGPGINGHICSHIFAGMYCNTPGYWSIDPTTPIEWIDTLTWFITYTKKQLPVLYIVILKTIGLCIVFL